MEQKLSYEYIIYYNHLDQGYDFYDKSPGFPEAYRRDLKEICSRIEEPKASTGNTVALRYSPVQDSFLWSVIFRQPNGDGHQLRGVTTAVNLLMTAEQADQAFQTEPDKLLWNIEAEARALLETQEIPIVTNMQQPIAATSIIPTVQLLNVASYAGASTLSKQAYFVMETPILPEVASMLKILPVKLRKHTSFHTGIQSTRESIGIAVSFCTMQMMAESLRSNLSGGQSNTDKYLYYFSSDGMCSSRQPDKSGIRESSPLLQTLQYPPYPELFYPLMNNTIENWSQLKALPALANAGDPLVAMIKPVPENDLVSFLQANTLPTDILYTIDKYAKNNRLINLQNTLKRLLPVHLQPSNDNSSSDDLSEPIPENTELKKRKRKKRVPRTTPNSNAPMPHKILWSGIKLFALIALIWCAAVLLKGLVNINRIEQEQTVTLVIGLNTVKSFAKILGLTGITAAISSIITYHVMKWKRRKRRSEIKENQ